MKEVFSTIIFLLIIASCQNQTTEPVELHNKNLLKKVFYDSNNYDEYFYNKDEKLSKIKFVRKGNLEMQTDFEYDNNQNMIKANAFTALSGVDEYLYYLYEYTNQGLLSKTYTYLKINNNYELRSTQEFLYNISGDLIIKNIYDTTNTIVKYTEYFYDSNKNVTETKFYQNGELSFNDNFEYDNKKNPLYQIWQDYSIFSLSQNNVIKQTSINYMISIDTSINEILYEYNDNDYPITCLSNSQKYFYEYY